MSKKRSTNLKIRHLELAEWYLKKVIEHLQLAANRDIDGDENIYTDEGKDVSEIELLDLQELSDTLHYRIANLRQ